MLISLNTMTPAISEDICIPTDNTKYQNIQLINILLVEDVISNEVLALNSFNLAKIPFNMHPIRKGNEVMPFFTRPKRGKRQSLPDLILPDLGLPGLMALKFSTIFPLHLQ